jgi:carbon-monoxide dehydrogenase small subunit
MQARVIELTVNGDPCTVAVHSNLTLLQLIRERLLLTGTKHGCGSGDCGACTVLLEGRPVNACLTLAVEASGKSVTTIEGIAPSGKALHPVQQAFVERGAIQCGYCTPGMIMSAVYLLATKPDPTESEIRHAIGGNICRCTGYTKIVEAIGVAARMQQEEEQ